MNLNVKLDKNFTTAFNKMVDTYGEDMAYVNGFGDKQLSYTDFIDNFIDKKTVADASVDGSANVGQKSVVTLMNEMSKPHQKLLAFNKIYYEMNKKYGFKAANDFLESDYTGKSYLHDSNSSTFLSYCFAYDLKDLAERGLYFIDNFNAEPPKHLGTFVDFVKEFVSFAANSTSGAVGMPNLIVYMYYFWDRDVKAGYYTQSPEQYAKQQIQRIIYALNQPFLRGSIQSAFTNTSIFDKNYLEALFGGSQFPDGTFMIDELDGIMKFQKFFLEEMSEIRSHNMMTYPVNTISLLRKDGKFQDEEFAKWAVKHNMKWCDSNLFIDDSVSSLSNCPLAPETLLMYHEPHQTAFVQNTLENVWNKLSKEKRRVIVVPSNGREVYCKINRFYEPANYEIALANGTKIKTTEYHLNKVRGKEYTHTYQLKEGDELPYEDVENIFSTEGKYTSNGSFTWVKINKISRCETQKNVSYCLEVLDDVEPIFTLANGIITHNCRLKNDIKELYFNSIGGTALKVGSVKVNTINLARIAYDCDGTEEDYLRILKERVILCCKVLDTVRHIIQRNVEKGLMKNFSSGMIDFEHLYSTIGVIGIYEAIKTFGYTYKDEFGNTFYKPEAFTFGEKIFQAIHNTKDEWGKENNIDYKINIEAVPGESAAAKLMKKDAFFYPEKVVRDLPLYGNQFIPLGIKTTLEERVRIGAAFDSYCNGGYDIK